VADTLEKLLQNPRLWRGRDQANTPGWQGLPSGYPKLDRYLPGGGWPQHALTEILLEHYGMGELQLLMPAGSRGRLDSLDSTAFPTLPTRIVAMGYQPFTGIDCASQAGE